MKQMWKDVVGYEGIYIISSDGVLKSLDHIVLRKDNTYRLQYGKIKKPQKSVKGYLQTCITKHGKRLNTGIHRLVATAFIPNPENKPQVNHKDGNKLNNHVSNLEWVTNRENQNHAILNKLHNPNYGNKHHMCKISESNVLKLRQERIEGKTLKELAIKYNVTVTAIWLIVKGKNHIKTK